MPFTDPWWLINDQKVCGASITCTYWELGILNEQSADYSLITNWLPPFSLIHDFGKQNNHGNVSKISVSLTCYWQIGSKSTNHSSIAWRREGYKVTLVSATGGFQSDRSMTHKTDGNFGKVSAAVSFPKSHINENGGNH